MINRNKYLELLIANKNNGFPKVITGIRRCGKSFLLKEIFKQYLLNQSVPEKNILVIELDDDKNTAMRDPIILGEQVRKYCENKSECYVILDEIQKVIAIRNPIFTEGKHIPAKSTDTDIITFVDVVLGLSREKNIDLYVTGSNSKMLSSDIITEFRDKAVNIHLNSLSFSEFFTYKNLPASEAFYEYMQYGGMPLAVLKEEEQKKEYLKNLFETTYFRDIVERNGLRKSESLSELCSILSETTGQLLNSETLANTFESVKHEKIDKKSVDRYISLFVDSFIIKEARRYDLKGKTEIGALRKFYFTDTGLRNACLNFAFPDEGQMLENIVYNELVYNGFSVNIGTFDTIEKNKNRESVRKTNEIDFYAKKGNRRYYIQVSSDISSDSVKTRELRPFFKLNNQIQKVLVINKPIKNCIDENGFTVIGITEFLLNFIVS